MIFIGIFLLHKFGFHHPFCVIVTFDFNNFNFSTIYTAEYWKVVKEDRKNKKTLPWVFFRIFKRLCLKASPQTCTKFLLISLQHKYNITTLNANERWIYEWSDLLPNELLKRQIFTFVPKKCKESAIKILNGKRVLTMLLIYLQYPSASSLPDEEKKSTCIFIFTLFCGASKNFS